MATASKFDRIPPKCVVVDRGVQPLKVCRALADRHMENGSFYSYQMIYKWDGGFDRRNARLLLYIPIQQSISL